MRSAAASISRNVAVANGAFDWHLYLNKMSTAGSPISHCIFYLPVHRLLCLRLTSIFPGGVVLSCACAMRPIIRPFLFMFRPLSWIAARFAGALDALGFSAVCQRTHAVFIGPVLHGVRSYATNFLGFSSRGLSFVASRFPASMTGFVRCYLARWPSVLFLGLLVLASPLRRFVTDAAAHARW
jgi:hypothetical protein